LIWHTLQSQTVIEATKGLKMRRRDHMIDKEIGATIRVQRVRMKMSQIELGEALGVTFQQIQKYESGTNAVASTRVGLLCRILNTSPNVLFGSDVRSTLDAIQLTSREIKTLLRLREVPRPLRRAVDDLLETIAGKPRAGKDRGAYAKIVRLQPQPTNTTI
jgi:transcriptional regulator with XRE-family HTH domain